MSRRNAHRKVFSRVYAERAWGDTDSASGPGSGIERTAGLRRELPLLLEKLAVETLLDAGCGDFHWLRLADLPIRRYIGIDVVPELVAELDSRYGGPGRDFLARDITRDALPRVDFVMCREVLMHFPDNDVKRAVANFQRSGARWLLTTTFVDRASNEPIGLGDWRPQPRGRAVRLPTPQCALWTFRCSIESGISTSDSHCGSSRRSRIARRCRSS